MNPSPHTPINARTRRLGSGAFDKKRKFTSAVMLAPSMLVVAGLFGGGLVLGMIQGLGYLPSAGMNAMTWDHFRNVLSDPDFISSLKLTFYLSFISTLTAAALSVCMALTIFFLLPESGIRNFIFQIPLTVPHLAVAVSMVFMLSPSGFLSRLLTGIGVTDAASDFPLLVNDPWGVGIMVTYIWKEIPFITLMVLSALKMAGAELTEVGKTLKADSFKRFRYIIFPLISPSLGAACLIVFAFTFGAFEVPYLLGQTYPVPLPVQAYEKYADVDLLSRPEGIATGMIIALSGMILIGLSQRLVYLARRRGAVL